MGGGDKINEVICGQIDGEGEAIDQRSREVGGGGREGGMREGPPGAAGVRSVRMHGDGAAFNLFLQTFLFFMGK